MWRPDNCITMFRVAILVVLVAVVFTTSVGVGAENQATQSYDDSQNLYRRDYQEQPQSSYADPPPQQMYMVYSAAPMHSYGEMEEEKEKEMEPKTKEEKKCAVKLVLPPLIIITIFIGLILLHLVSPTLLPAFADPFVLPFVAIINALTGQAPAIILGGNGREDQGNQTSAQGAFGSLLHLTTAVTAAVDHELCFSRVLCHAGSGLPKDNSWAKTIKWILPKEYQPYLTLMEKARSGGIKACAKDYPCQQIDEWQ